MTETSMASLELQEKSRGRVLLPSVFIPKRYDLHLTPDLNNFTFDGKVDIELERTSNDEITNEITLHAKELLIIQVSLVTTCSGKTSTSQQPIEVRTFVFYILYKLFNIMDICNIILTSYCLRDILPT